MDQKQLRAKTLSCLRKQRKIEREVKDLEKQLIRQLCPKEKQECEPEYCAFRMTGTCPFLREWREILHQVDT